MQKARSNTRGFKAGDRVRLFSLDGKLGDEVFTLDEVWGEGAPHNASFTHFGCEQTTHTDLMKHENDKSPVVVPDGGVWYIAIGNNFGWGRAETETQAVANMRRQGGKVTSYVVYRANKWTAVGDMGGLRYPNGIKPVEVTRVEPKRKRA
jgi:hypothetical protein